MTRARTASARRGVLLIDLLVAMAIIGVVLLAALPSVRSDEPLRLVAGATTVAADIEYAQALTLASPAEPVVVVFDDSGTSYWLALSDDPQTPIEAPAGGAWVRDFTGGDMQGVTLARTRVARMPDDGPAVIAFDAFGRLTQSSDLALTLANTAGEQVVWVRAVTGTVHITPDLPEHLTKSGSNPKEEASPGGVGVLDSSPRLVTR